MSTEFFLVFVFIFRHNFQDKILQIQKSLYHWIIMISISIIKLFLFMSSFKNYDY